MKALTICLAAITLALAGTSARGQEANALPLDKALVKARCDGKYRMLLRQIYLPGDHEQFKTFHEFGFRTEKTCADYTDLPPGHWVYVYPYWYIWRDRTDQPQPKRAWGPEQAAGKPDTPKPGDIQTAWASQSQDGSDEWLMLEYETPVWAKAAHIYETFNPGAVVRITAFALDGREIDIWRRARPDIFNRPPNPAGQTQVFLGGIQFIERLEGTGIPSQYNPNLQPAEFGRVYRPAFQRRVLTNRIKVYLASKAVPGWNEIDAVGLRGEDGSLQWAVAAHASTTYASGGGGESVEAFRLLEGAIISKPLEVQIQK